MGESLRGLVLRSTGSWYSVEWDGGVYSCRTRGRIRLKGLRATNPIAVGDWVRFRVAGEGHGMIEAIEPRRNYIIRRATNLSKEYHIIAANLDQLAIVITLREPPTPLEFVDRLLATACAYGVPAVVVFAKQDLASERKAVEDLGACTIYARAQCSVIRVSSAGGEGMETLHSLLRGKTTLVAGNSGVGKSSLINSLSPGLDLRTAPLSAIHGRGQHTTTFGEMFALDAEGTRVIDTPGIKGFGVVEFDKGQVSHFFPDIFSLGAQCRFANCLHDQEPGCAVRDAVLSGELPESRYASYLSLLHNEEEEEKYR